MAEDIEGYSFIRVAQDAIIRVIESEHIEEETKGDLKVVESLLQNALEKL